MMTQHVPRDPYQKPHLEQLFDWKYNTGVSLSIGTNSLIEPLEITTPDLKLEGQ